MSDQLVAETSTLQHKTLTTENVHAPGGIRTHDLSRQAAADLRLRRRGYWNRQSVNDTLRKNNYVDSEYHMDSSPQNTP